MKTKKYSSAFPHMGVHTPKPITFILYTIAMNHIALGYYSLQSDR